MAVGQTVLPVLLPVEGVCLGATSAGIKSPGRKDLVVISLDKGATCAGVFTQNKFCAAPVIIARQNMSETTPRLFVINTGNANAGTGKQGLSDARAVCSALAALHECQANEVLPFSTGVIGEIYPLETVKSGLPGTYQALNKNGWVDAANGILTTDTFAKGASKKISIDGHAVTVTGIAKGSGMIRPDMATMLAFIATDVAISKKLLDQCLQTSVAASFNRITVDGDTSTNDACILMATAKSNLPLIKEENEVYRKVCDAIAEVCEQLAQAIVRDGEGATKLITIDVFEGTSEQECKEVAYTIAHSPLVKTAFFAKDPNWGRILAAVGRADVENLDISAMSIFLNDVCIVSNGGRAPGYTEKSGQDVMDLDEITIRVNLGRGLYSARIWTCDLSYDYVRINAEYRS
ncbi:MAG: bifunctional glutamate N-acetyltransferase/amino-acid acetyltransferase ArgJ [Gammaproteobacteria bacterium]|nr:bifunctional glutamate N-acetyltransferase/amino-acid acetyltransferase ArgJ [Gammaproteobacteria bacterium]